MDDVVCEGLRLLQLREKWKTEAREKIDVGWEQAKRGELLTSEEARRNLESRKQEWRGENG